MHNAKDFVAKLEALATPDNKTKYERLLKANERDEFLGVSMGRIFALAKESIDMPLDEIEKLLESPLHEARVGAVSIMDFQARSTKTPESQREALFNLYLRRHDRINSWDLVDRSVLHVIGKYLQDKPRGILYTLAQSNDPQERRSAILATGYFIRLDETTETFRLAATMLDEPHALTQKAVGWMLREAGKKDKTALVQFLDQHAARMPRDMLRNAIEKLDKATRAAYLKKHK